MSGNILIVEDDPMQRQMLKSLLRRKMEIEAQEAEHGRDALDILQLDHDQRIKLIILDQNMPVMSGLETLEVLRQKHPNIPVIMLTGSTNINDAVEALKLGALDFINKPYQGERMILTVRNALRIGTLTKEVSRLKSEHEGSFTFDNLIGSSAGLRHVVQEGRKASASDIPVLITGETGTGKEVFSKAIHGESNRTGAPFIAVNCGAIPEQLVESTLFGHEKGSFTGATQKVIGKFREAEGGTIFLDEVGELPLDTQVKLLRVLQQKEVEPVGAGQPVPINVRIISATNRDLQEEVNAGRFREDLFFRLNVIHLELPSLRDRKEDIPALADHFIERFCINEGAIPKAIDPTLERELVEFDWPGNIRQLENNVNRAMVMSDGQILGVDDFHILTKLSEPSDINDNNNKQIKSSSTIGLSINLQNEDRTFKTVYDIEQEAIQAVLNHFDNNITQSAKALGIAKSTFYKKIKKSTSCDSDSQDKILS